MLKRVNIHLDDADLKEIEAILKKMQTEKNAEWGIHYAKRATLIRFAIAQTFNLKYHDRYPNFETLKKALKKALRKAT